MNSRCVRNAAWKEAIMRQMRLVLMTTLVLAFLRLPATAQQIRFVPDFSGGPSMPGNLRLNGSTLAVYNSGLVLRLTQANSNTLSTSTYFRVPQPVLQGFFTYFSFKVHDANCCAPGDGFAFILQGSTATDSTQGAMGSGLTAVGPAMGGMGYSGINNSLAVEFDMLQNPWDPNSNHIAIQTCGGNPSKFNSPVHDDGVYTIGNNHDITSCLLDNALNANLASNLGPTCNEDSCTDGPIHQVVIQYTPPMGQQTGLLQVYLDPQFQPGSHVPVPGAPTVLSVPYNLFYSPTNQLGLVPANLSSLFVGFTAASENGGADTDILSWEFTPQAPSQITLPIPPGGTENDFSFGGHQLGVTYPTGFNNNCQPGSMDCIFMTVTATPVNQQTFYAQRLQGTQFADENCIIYSQTGGNCLVYSVTCQENGQPVMCPQELETDDIAICTRFETPEPVSLLNTDFLKADPIGSNNWCSIWTFFNNQDDPVVGGKGTGFSDIVATLSPTGPGPMCASDLQGATTAIQKTTSTKPITQQGGTGFCPPID
jgi:Legume lectin domain